ncbi:LysR family transcriptional regulator [Noviherbaspirillum massiliense]|uniref:LysR family transcriptional regulator n=1 Tax=Noviherbaspirillum massiliense TaxID=1465823 RepID=UPI000364E469|nr:LysR family transcriptional regulator [Noviherbaspirillum massiliense]
MVFDGAPISHYYRPRTIPNLCVSLKQWRILHAVIDCGGFAEAAKFLHLSQSAISYTIAKLQEQLGVQLLKIEGRKAILTTEGHALLERSRHVLKEAIELETFAKTMEQGWAGEVRLVVDHHFPTRLLMGSLRKFSLLSKGAAHVKLSILAAPQPEELLRKQVADLVIGERVPLGFLGEPLVEVEHVPVAHPDHPLLRMGRELTAADLARFIQIDVGHADESDRGDKGGPDYVRWSMNSLDAVVQAVQEGLGYAWLPAHRIQSWLDEESLVRLPLAGCREYKTVLYLIHSRPWSANPATNRLVEILRGAADGDTDEPGTDADREILSQSYSCH